MIPYPEYACRDCPHEKWFHMWAGNPNAACFIEGCSCQDYIRPEWMNMNIDDLKDALAQQKRLTEAYRWVAANLVLIPPHDRDTPESWWDAKLHNVDILAEKLLKPKTGGMDE